MRTPMTPDHRRIVIATGASGGHIYPAVGCAQTLKVKDPNCAVFFVTGKKDIESTLLGQSQQEIILKNHVVPFKGWASLISLEFLSGFNKTFWDARKVLRSLQPHCIVGFGGSSTVPVLLAARSLGIQTAIHEQNVSLGLANRFLTYWVKVVMLTFDAMCRWGGKKRFTGLPLRHSLKKLDRAEALQQLGLDSQRKTLLIMGGSQGSRDLNEMMLAILEKGNEELLKEWQFIHLAGGKGEQDLLRGYRRRASVFKLFTFYENMSVIYSAADVVICRAGATTLHELAFFGKCSILVPHPMARGHQTENARVLSRGRGAILLPSEELNAHRVANILKTFLEEPNEMILMGERCRTLLKTNGSELVADTILELANESSK
jgi:UDP-N-acetylglucosamine--N-acetylmuramyl-(pentapeptide) pyrophosphoryl-undecaprenol N-acetylglucosamine transferase